MGRRTVETGADGTRHNGAATGANWLLLHSPAAMADKPRVKAPKQRSTPKADDPGARGGCSSYGAAGLAALAGHRRARCCSASAAATPSAERGAQRARRPRAARSSVAPRAPRRPHGRRARRHRAEAGTPTRRRAARTTAIARDLRDLRGAARDRARRPQPRARRHLHPLRRRGPGRDRRRSSERSTTTTRTGRSSRRCRGWGPDRARRVGARTARAGNGYLAKCAEFDEDAVSAFFDAFQFKGPERFDPSRSQPGTVARVYTGSAGVAERVRRARLKSGCPHWGRAGSSPAPGIGLRKASDPARLDAVR